MSSSTTWPPCFSAARRAKAMQLLALVRRASPLDSQIVRTFPIVFSSLLARGSDDLGFVVQALDQLGHALDLAAGGARRRQLDRDLAGDRLRVDAEVGQGLLL